MAPCATRFGAPGRDTGGWLTVTLTFAVDVVKPLNAVRRKPYAVPRVDMQVTATVQSSPGPQILANFTATNAIVAPSLGRNLSGGAANTTVNIVQPGTMYGDRSNQMQLRLAKILKYSGARTTASVDIYNVFNSNTVLTVNNAYGTWLAPTSISYARWAKLVLQIDF